MTGYKTPWRTGQGQLRRGRTPRDPEQCAGQAGTVLRRIEGAEEPAARRVRILIEVVVADGVEHMQPSPSLS